MRRHQEGKWKCRRKRRELEGKEQRTRNEPSKPGAKVQAQAPNNTADGHIAGQGTSLQEEAGRPSDQGLESEKAARRGRDSKCNERKDPTLNRQLPNKGGEGGEGRHVLPRPRQTRVIKNQHLEVSRPGRAREETLDGATTAGKKHKFDLP